MGCSDQLLPTISALVALGEFSTGNQPVDAASLQTVSDMLPAAEKQQRAEREWQGAIAALSQLLNQQISGQQMAGKMSPKERAKAQKNARSKSPKALVISGPVPLFNDPSLAPQIASQISNWTLVPQSSDQFASAFSALSPDLSNDLSSSDLSTVKRLFQQTFNKQSFHTRLLPLLKEDPLAQEQFVVVLTAEFSMVLVLGKDADSELRFQFSFMPEVVKSVWRMLRSRIRAVRPQQLEFIDPLVEKFAPKDPHYRIVSQFNRWMLACLPQSANSNNTVQSAVQSVVHQGVQTENGHHAHQLNSHQTPEVTSAASVTEAAGQFSDSALLKAMAHEIRTPLTTIRTYTRSLLKRENMDPQVIKRLKSIDRECTQQIDRFSLIFRAVELEAASQTAKSPLSAIALHQVFQEAIPQWQQAAQRRNLSLEVGLPPELPMVASDPTMLQHVLTGLVELFTHSVSPGSHIQLHVLHAGEQLKLQFQSQADPSRPNTAPTCPPPPLQSLGHLLMFQPETGGLSLNLKATKNLFHALGAKLTVRERSNQGTTWTVFLPLEASGLKSYPIV